MEETPVAKASTIQYLLTKLKIYFDKKSDRSTTLLLTIPVNEWAKETREEMLSFGIGFYYIYPTQIKYNLISNISAIIQLSSSITAKNAGIATILEYDKNTDGNTIIKFFAESMPMEDIQVSVLVQY